MMKLSEILEPQEHMLQFCIAMNYLADLQHHHGVACEILPRYEISETQWLPYFTTYYGMASANEDLLCLVIQQMRRYGM